MTTFKLNQIFIKEYPPEAAEYCNNHGDRYITEIEKDKDGNRRFKIVSVPAPSEEEIERRFYTTIEGIILQQAIDMGYTSVESLCSYIDSGNEKWDNESKIFRLWRTKCWETVYAYNGNYDIKIDEIKELLPKIELP